MSNPPPTEPASPDLADPVVRGLACAALQPGLRSILLFDASAKQLAWASAVLEQLLVAATGRRVAPVNLGSVQEEHELWIGLDVESIGGHLEFRPGPGLLGPPADGSLRLVIVPDLARMSLAGTRAAVTLVGAELAYLGWQGTADPWPSDMCWLAACAIQEVGQVSPHLLDRFAVRLRAARPSKPVDRVQEILAALRPAPDTAKRFSLPEEVAHAVIVAVKSRPRLTRPALTRVLNLSAELGAASPRRDQALTRLAVATAQLDGSPEVTAAHVDNAAVSIGWRGQTNRSDPIRPPLPGAERDPDKRATPPAPEPSPAGPVADPGRASAGREPSAERPVVESGPREDVGQVVLLPEQLVSSPYPEDTAAPQRESESLQMAVPHYRSVHSARGPIIGVDQATASLHDVAMFSTLIEAAKFSAARNRYAPAPSDPHRLRILPIDLRKYRRAPVADAMLALVLDYTCRGQWAWIEALMPYLRWAYVARATICVVQVGANAATSPLRAERILARNLLDVKVIAALEPGDAPPVAATPLAHGLELVLHALRHALQHGASNVRHAKLVVVTDGRGNVPLAMSHAAVAQSGPAVGTQGVEDALGLAREIAALDNVEAVVITPDPPLLGQLPFTLAQALQAIVVPKSAPALAAR